MMRDNPKYPKIYESLSTKKYVWVCRYNELKRIRITKIDWIPNPNNPRHPCVIRTGNDNLSPYYTYDEVYLTKEKCVAKLKKDLRTSIATLTKQHKGMVVCLRNKLKALAD